MNEDQPKRETPDFAAIAAQFTKFTQSDIEIIWDRNDEISTVSDFRFFLLYCKQHDLNPIMGEVVASMRYDSIKRKRVMTPIVKIGVLRKRRALECDGIDQATFTYDGAQLVSASGSIYRKGAAKPFSTTVYYKEYAPQTDSGGVVYHWREKPHIMLGACLEAQLTRIAFFDLCGDFLTDEEMQSRERPDSTMGEPTAEDEARVGALAGKVGVKATPAAAPVETAAPLAETKEPVVETKPAETVAPAPPVETKPAVPETKPALSPKERMANVIEKFGMSPKSAQATFNTFCRSFLATDTLPKKAEVYVPLIEKLEAAVADPAQLKALIADPRRFAEQSAGRKPDPIEEYGRKYSWPPESVRTLKEIAKARELPPQEAVDWMNALEVNLLTTPDTSAFLRLAQYTRKAYLILDASRKYNISVHILVENLESTLGMPLPDLPAERLDQALELVDSALAVKNATALGMPEQEEMPF